jgi:hypothetical protein
MKNEIEIGQYEIDIYGREMCIELIQSHEKFLKLDYEQKLNFFQSLIERMKNKAISFIYNDGIFIACVENGVQKCIDFKLSGRGHENERTLINWVYSQSQKFEKNSDKNWEKWKFGFCLKAKNHELLSEFLKIEGRNVDEMKSKYMQTKFVNSSNKSMFIYGYDYVVNKEDIFRDDSRPILGRIDSEFIQGYCYGQRHLFLGQINKRIEGGEPIESIIDFANNTLLEGSDKFDNLPRIEIDSITRKIGFVIELGIFEHLEQRYGIEKGHIRLSQILESFTGLNQETIKKAYAGHIGTGNKKNDPFNAVGNREYVEGLLRTMKLNKKK